MSGISTASQGANWAGPRKQGTRTLVSQQKGAGGRGGEGAHPEGHGVGDAEFADVAGPQRLEMVGEADFAAAAGTTTPAAWNQ